jgi:uncharacterized repeat protein (TIGR01451 family)
MITAAGITEGGTSQASPHVAGAIAVLRSTFPSETLAQIQTRMTSSGVSITDSRNGLAKPRLDLLHAARPGNDLFANQFTLSGLSGSINFTTQLSTKETNEPAHAGNTGGASVWWKWTAPANGQLSVDTHGSGFDTLLGVYTGASVSTLAPIVANDNDGTLLTSSVLLQVQSGKEYEIAVDGAQGSAGLAVLNFSLNTSAFANLSAVITGPGSVSAGANAQYVITVSNAGPQTATNLVISATLPTGAIYASGPANCNVNASTVTCLIATLANGASLATPLMISFNAISSPATITAIVSSDLPDTVISNNATTLQLALLPPTVDTSDTDAPTLPEWGVLLLGALLLGASRKAKAHL